MRDRTPTKAAPVLAHVGVSAQLPHFRRHLMGQERQAGHELTASLGVLLCQSGRMRLGKVEGVGGDGARGRRLRDGTGAHTPASTGRTHLTCSERRGSE